MNLCRPEVSRLHKFSAHYVRLKQLIEDLSYKRLENISNCEIKGITPDSKGVLPGYLFVAIEGRRFDGHAFVNQAIDKGAKALILQNDTPLKKKVAKILVSDSQTALARACASFFSYPTKQLKIVGITGTNGKTTVSYLIEKILACAGLSCGVVGTVNYRLGQRIRPAINTTPQADILQSLLQEFVLAKSKYAIIEVSSHALAQRRVEEVEFSQGLFTNLSKEHLDYHTNLANYFSCKASLFERLSPESCAIINIDDPYGRKLLKKVKSHVLTYGIERPAQIQAKNLKLSLEDSRFQVVTPKAKLELVTALIGRHNIYNILAAISSAFIENIDFSHIISGIKNFDAVPGRLQRIDCGQNFLIFVDYAHTEDALKKVLTALRNLSKKRIILVFGCGGDRDKLKRPKMGRVATGLADLTIITTDNPRSESPSKIISDILKGIDKGANNFKVVLDRFQAIAQALSSAGKGDIVLVAGKGHESSQTFAHKTIPFNDRKVIEKLLQCSQLRKS